MPKNLVSTSALIVSDSVLEVELLIEMDSSQPVSLLDSCEAEVPTVCTNSPLLQFFKVLLKAELVSLEGRIGSEKRVSIDCISQSISKDKILKASPSRPPALKKFSEESCNGPFALSERG